MEGQEGWKLFKRLHRKSFPWSRVSPQVGALALQRMCGNIRSRVVVPSGLRWPALLAVGGRMPGVDVLGVQPQVLQRGSVLRVRAPLSDVVRGAATSALVSGRGELIKAAGEITCGACHLLPQAAQDTAVTPGFKCPSS